MRISEIAPIRMPAPLAIHEAFWKNTVDHGGFLP